MKKNILYIGSILIVFVLACSVLFNFNKKKDEKYAVIYEVKNNKILILYIFHENQNYLNLLLNQENLN